MAPTTPTARSVARTAAALLALAAGAAVFILPAPMSALAALPANRPQGPCGTPGIVPPNARAHGASYAQWSARWWQWALEQPLAGHPFVDDPSFNVASGQSGSVWFLGAPFGTVERTCTIPPGKALFVGLLNAEASDLEGLGSTAQEQRDNANFLADHIVGVFCTIDGRGVANIGSYRFTSPQFSFTAPTPWIFGDTGGAGTSVGDGYYVFLEPLSAGHHTIHFGGAFHFAISEGDPFDLDAPLDMTYHLTVR